MKKPKVSDKNTDDWGLLVTGKQLRVLLEGLCVWNCPALNLLTERGVAKLRAAQVLIEKLYYKERVRIETKEGGESG